MSIAVTATAGAEAVEEQTNETAPLAGLDGDAGVDSAGGRRHQTRTANGARVEFRNTFGQLCWGRLTNISPGGIQVDCNVATAQALHPCGGRIGASGGPIAQATLRLPSGGEVRQVKVAVRLLYCAGAGVDSRCLLGFEFLDLRPLAKRALERFFSSQEPR